MAFEFDVTQQDAALESAANSGFVNGLVKGTPLVLGAALTSLYRIPSDMYTFATDKPGYWDENSNHMAAQKLSELLNTDMVSYYDAHKTGIELGGTVLSSFVPGTLAIKAGNAMARGVMTSKVVSSYTGIASTYDKARNLTYAVEAVETGKSAALGKTLYGAALAGETAFQTLLFEAGSQLVNYQTPTFQEKSGSEIAMHSLETAGIFSAIAAPVGYVFSNSAKGGLLGAAIKSFNEARISVSARTDLSAGVYGATLGDKIVGAKLSEAAVVLPESMTPAIAEVATNASKEVNKAIMKHITDLDKSKGSAEGIYSAVQSYSKEEALQVFGGLRQLDHVGKGLPDNALFLNPTTKAMSTTEIPLAATLADKGIKVDYRNLSIRALDGTVEGFKTLTHTVNADTLANASIEAIAGARQWALGAQKIIQPAGVDSLFELEAQLFLHKKLIFDTGREMNLLEGQAFISELKSGMAETLLTGTPEAVVLIKGVATKVPASATPYEVVENKLASVLDKNTGLMTAYEHTDQTARKWYTATYNEAQASVWDVKDLAAYTSRMNMLSQDNKMKVAENLQTLGFNAERLPQTIDIFTGQILERTSSGTFTFANGKYGSIQEKAQFIGQQLMNTMQLLNRRDQGKIVNESQALTSLGQEASLLYSTISSEIIRHPNKYLATPEGIVSKEYLELKSLGEKAQAGKLTAGEETTRIPYLQDAIAKQPNGGVLLKNVEGDATAKAITNFLIKHAEMSNANRALSQSNASIKQGAVFVSEHPNALYIPPNMRDFKGKYVGIVTNAKNESHMLVEDTVAKYNEVSAAIKASDPTVSIVSHTEGDLFKKLKGEYENSLAIGRNNYNSEMLSKGKLYDPVPDLNFNEVNRLANWRALQNGAIARDTLSIHYSKEIAELDFLHNLEKGDALVPLRDGKGGIIDFIKREWNEPSDSAFSELKRTMLGVNKINSNVVLDTISNGPAKLIDMGANKSAAMWAEYKNNNLTLEQGQAILAKYGYKDTILNQELLNLSGYKNLDGATQQTVIKAKQIITTSILRVGEFANAAVQLMGASILLLPQTKSLQQAYNLDVSVGAMVGNGMKSAMQSKSELTDLFLSAGLLSKKETHLMELVGETNLVLGGKADKSVFKKLVDAASIPTDSAEYFTRNTALHTAALAGEAAGLVRNSPDWWALVNNFVSKVNSNAIASQRPTIFTGVTGQALSLFQSYQVNLMQQFFAHIAEGQGKQLAMMAAAQQTIFGLQSQPLFKALNERLIGNYNPNHEDAYTASSEFGKAGEILMYGLPSATLGAALWTRGDTNPRVPTIIDPNPVNWAAIDVPIKAGVMVKDMLMAIGKDDPGNKMLIALAHANISRPLTGLAELGLGKRISKGNELDATVENPFTGTADLKTIANMGIRLTGAKPLDEALIMDSFYRAGQYKVADNKIRKSLSSELKEALIAGDGEVSDDKLSEIGRKYANAGGSPQGLNMLLQNGIKATEKTRSERLAKQVGNNAQLQMLQELLNK